MSDIIDGQAVDPDPAALDGRGICAQIPGEAEARQGLFGPRAAVPQGSSAGLN